MAALICALAMRTTPAAAQEDCPRAVLIALPGVTWADIERVRPTALLAAVEDGAAASLSVRTIASRTSYASGFATIGGGARIEGGGATGGRPRGAPAGLMLERDVAIGSLAALRDLADDAGYGAKPGALGTALEEAGVTRIAVGNADAGNPPPAPAGFGRFTMLATMNAQGVTDMAAVSSRLLRGDAAAPFGVRTDMEALGLAAAAALEEPCSFTVIDQGDLIRADATSGSSGEVSRSARTAALLASDDVIASARALLSEDDLLLLVSPTSTALGGNTHLGVAVAVGPAFDAGSSLRSATTRRDGIVTLPDIAPTVIEHFGLARPASMTGRPFRTVAAGGDRIDAALALDEESVFVDGLRGDISTVFVIVQVLIYALVIALLRWRERRGGTGSILPGALEFGALGVIAFPLSTYLAGSLPAYGWGIGAYVALLVGMDLVSVAVAVLVARSALDRLLVLAGGTLSLLVIDLVSGGALQINTVFGYSPVVAGRFAGAGNIAFAVLGVSGLLTGALVVHRWGGTGRTLALAGALYAVVVIVDGAPQYGSDVGGILALVPALAVTWILLSGRRPSVRSLLAAVLVAGVILGLFLAIDLARPPDARTHLARLFEDVRERGTSVFVDTVERKASANLRVFRTTIWTYFVPPALAVMGWLLLRPRGRWDELARRNPELRHGLVGGLLLAVLGFAVNDSGIVVPAVILSFLVPMAVLIHLSLAREADGEGG